MRISDWSSDVCSSDLLEPQAQLLWQQVKLDDRADSFSTIDFATGDVLTGRAGLRLQGEYGGFQPYLHASLWHGFSGDQTTRFGTDPIRTDLGARKSVVQGKSGSVRVDLGGRRIIQKKTKQTITTTKH